MAETITLAWSDLTTQVMTNLYVYGRVDTPVDCNDRDQALVPCSDSFRIACLYGEFHPV
jgi:hypothetical protein